MKEKGLDLDNTNSIQLLSNDHQDKLYNLIGQFLIDKCH